MGFVMLESYSWMDGEVEEQCLSEEKRSTTPENQHTVSWKRGVEEWKNGG